MFEQLTTARGADQKAQQPAVKPNLIIPDLQISQMSQNCMVGSPLTQCTHLHSIPNHLESTTMLIFFRISINMHLIGKCWHVLKLVSMTSTLTA